MTSYHTPKCTLKGFKKDVLTHLIFKKQQNYKKTNISHQRKTTFLNFEAIKEITKEKVVRF